MTDFVLPATGIGFLVGFRHAFEPDHLAAVTTLASLESRWARAARLGVVWGVGHTLSIGAVAALLIVLGVALPQRFFAMAEFGVAVLLVLVGTWALVLERRPAHQPPVAARTAAGALGFGVIHGLAGSGAVIVLLLAASSQLIVQAGYLTAFGVGTAIGMSIASLTVGAAAGLAVRRSEDLVRAVRLGAGALSVMIGLLLGIEVLRGA